MPMFPDAWMGELLAKNDIVGIVSEYVPLKPKGGRMWGCCPFHTEKTPSFSVTRDKQLYYCFGCHAGGGVIQFVMEMEKLPFVDAVKYLAQRAGMELPGEVDDEKLRRERALRERIYAANKEAARYYYDMLLGPQGEKAREYLGRRGVDGKTVRHFGLGYAPPGWDNLGAYLLEKGHARETLIEAGLVLRGKKQGESYDAFRDRVIFPIIDTSARVLGFGARTMGEETPKYINTSDTPVYNKRNHLYGLNLLKRKKLADMVMVEGYMDVISLYRGGVDNAVAGLGTALTAAQVRLLKRYVPTVYLCYDGDEAGQNATLRALDIFAKEKLDVRVVAIPGGEDPDDYVRRGGKEAFLDLKARALRAAAFRLEHMARRFDLETADGRETFARQACALLGTLEPVERERYVPLVAQKAGVSAETVQAQCGLSSSSGNSVSSYRHTRTRESGKNGVHKTQATLLACMLISPDGAARTAALMREADVSFSSPLQELADRLLAHSMAPAQAPETSLALLAAEAPPELAEALSAAQACMQEIVESEKTARDCIRSLKREAVEAAIAEKTAAMPAPDSQGFLGACTEIAKLQRELAALKNDMVNT